MPQFGSGVLAAESIAFSVPFAAPVAIQPSRVSAPGDHLTPLKTKLFRLDLRVLKRNVLVFSLRIFKFSPKLEGRPIFPTRFNALI